MFLFILTLVFACNLFADEVLDQYSKVQIRPLPNTTYPGTKHLGIILTFTEGTRLGLYGAKRNDSK